ncbi:MAG: hypothetical protein WCI76_01550 [bacterium]
MLLTNKTIQQFTSSLLIISFLVPTIFLSSGAKQSYAQAGQVPTFDLEANTTLTAILGPTGTTAAKEILSWGQKLLELALKITAKKILAKMTQATINWINSDFHGSPLFIENPESFFKDIAKSQLKFIVDAIGYDTFRFPFGPQTALNAIASYKGQLQINAQYTLSKVINDPDFLIRYRSNFNYGGWNGFLINTQYPQNNYIGFQNLIQENLASRLAGTIVAPAQKVQQTLQQGLGFLSPQKCPDNPNYNNGVNEFLKPTFTPKSTYVPPTGENPTEAQYLKADNDYNSAVATEKSTFYAKDGPNYCPGGLVSTTPGSVAANQIFSALDTPRQTNTLAGAIGNSLEDSVAAIFDALINHFLEKGLNALSETISGKPSIDNWSYQGQGVGSGGTITTSTAFLNLPTDVSVSVGQSSSIDISGGNGIYCLQSITNCPSTVTIGGVATVKISGNADARKLTVTGLAHSLKPTQTQVFVTDTMGTSSTIHITVNDVGEFAIIPASPLKTTVNGSISATLSGGKTPYTLNTDKNKGSVVDPSIATIAFAGTDFVVTGQSRGVTYATILDNAGHSIPVEIDIASNASFALGVDPKNIQLDGLGDTKNITITNGNPPYTAEGSDKIAIGVWNDTTKTFTVTAKGGGATSLYVTDSSDPQRAGFVNVDVNAPVTGQDGICTENGTGSTLPKDLYPTWGTRYLITTKTKAECDQTRGGWEARNITAERAGPLGICQYNEKAYSWCGIKSRCADAGKWGASNGDGAWGSCLIKPPLTTSAQYLNPKRAQWPNPAVVATATISGGTATYKMDTTSLNTNIATVTFDGTTVTATGLKQGSTGVTIKDSASPAAGIPIYIIVQQ